MTSFSILICAYNEERNIVALIRSIFRQSLSIGILFDSLVIVADGCTDLTETLIRRETEANDKIRLVCHKIRLGKALAFNQGKQQIHSDFLLSLDGDILLPDDNIFDRVLTKAIREKIDLAAVENRPVTIETGIYNIGYQASRGKHAIRKILQDSKDVTNNLYCATGRLMLLSKKLYTPLTLPDEPGTDLNMYLFCRKNDLSFQYFSDIFVYFRLPATMRDYIWQYIRTRTVLTRSETKKQTNHPRINSSVLVKALQADPAGFLCFLLLAFPAELAFLYARYISKKAQQSRWVYLDSTK